MEAHLAVGRLCPSANLLLIESEPFGHQRRRPAAATQQPVARTFHRGRCCATRASRPTLTPDGPLQRRKRAPRPNGPSSSTAARMQRASSCCSGFCFSARFVVVASQLVAPHVHSRVFCPRRAFLPHRARTGVVPRRPRDCVPAPTAGALLGRGHFCCTFAAALHRTVEVLAAPT